MKKTRSTHRIPMRGAWLGGIIAVTALLLGACGSSAGSAEGDTAKNPDAAKLLPADIAESGVVNVASTISYPPFNFFEEDGKTATGSTIDILDAVGEQLGVTMKYNDVPFDGVLAGIQADRFDLAMTGISVTPERQKEVTFVTSLNSGTNFLVPAGNPKHINTLIDTCGLHVGVVKGTNHGDTIAAFNKAKKCEAAGKKPVIVDYYESAGNVAAVESGRADARYTDFGGNAYTAKNSDGKLDAVGELEDVEPFGIAFAKDKPDLAKAVHAALQGLIDNGDYGKILDTWNLTPGALKTTDLLQTGS